MRKCFAILCAAVCMLTAAAAQNPKLNPLNYSGKMYVSAMEVLSTPRYVSYEDHAILSSEMSVPVTQVTVVQFDFANRTASIDGKEFKFAGAYVKEYSSEYSSTVVIYIEPIEGADKMELVWPEYGDPYLMQITSGDGKVDIAKMVLSHNPVAISEADALMQLLNSLGGY